MVVDAETSEKIRIRRLATERVLREHGPQSWIGPAAMAAELEPSVFVRRPHIDAMNAALSELLIEPQGALMIWSPPQVGKSWIVSQWTPAWWLTMRPQDRFVLGCYAESLALRNSLAARSIMAAHGADYGLSLSRDQASKSDWSLNTGGGMIARGVGGAITGQTMNIGLIDDPVKDREAAESELIRQKVWDWYSSVWLTRRSPDAREIVCMTRWRSDDLAGRILDMDGRVEEGGRWKVVHLPAVAIPESRERGVYPDVLGRAPGEPLSHPKIEVGDEVSLRAHWERARTQSTARDWNAMYQGVPFDAEGALLSEDDVRAATRDSGPEGVRRACVAVDPSGGGRDTAGVVGLVLDGDGHVWFTHDRTRRMSSTEWSRQACLLAQELEAGEIVVEKNFGGDMATTLVAQAWDQLLREGVVTGLCPMVRDVVARKSKVLRAEPIAQAIKLGRVSFVRGLTTLTHEWQMWTPGSKWSPGALDAAVHGATHLLPALPRGAQVTAVDKVSLDSVGAVGLAGLRIER